MWAVALVVVVAIPFRQPVKKQMQDYLKLEIKEF